MTFVFDNTWPPSFAKALDALNKNHSIKHLRVDLKYKGDTKDPIWLRDFKDKYVIIVTGDFNLLINQHEQKLVLESGCTYFVFRRSFTQLKLWEQFKRLINVWPEIKKLAEKHREKAIFIVPLRGTKIKRLI